MIGLFAATPESRRRASELAARWGSDALMVDGPIGPSLRRMWPRLDSVVLFLGTGAAVHLIVPLLRDERADPPVVCADPEGRFAVALTGEHVGGNVLAVQVAEVLGGAAVTSGTTGGSGPLDDLLDAVDATVDGDLAGCASALDEGEPVKLLNPHGFALPPLPDNVSTDHDDPVWTVLVDDRAPVGPDRDRLLWLVPRTLVVGLGATSDATRTEIAGTVAVLERDHGLDPRAVRAVATVERADGHEGLVDAVQDLGFWHSQEGGDELALHWWPPRALDEVDVPNPSATVRGHSGTGSVAEAAALLSARECGGGAGIDLVVPKVTSGRVTVAAARIRPRGRLAVVGVGPGPDDLRTPRADAELRRAAVVVGSAETLDRVRPVLLLGTDVLVGGRSDALDLANSGRAVAFVHSGAAEAFDADADRVELVHVPGV